ncbi:YSIRK-type signal peptide-containing protein, partial [Staphylococcus epidermidis]|uniref:YSIRK-type signal peptide-containing protein n=1 Tax=Staphylococcus epidermidis TaxID=1282 RepID=UPI0030BDBDCA
MKKTRKKLDFLPNKLNKYSIRKFTVGTASILVGATLIFGAGHNVAEATEEDGSTNQSSTEDKTTSESTETNQSPTEDKTTSESTETNQSSTEDKTTSESTETNQSSTEDKTTSESTETNQSPTEDKTTSEGTETNQPSTEDKTTSESTKTNQSSTEDKTTSESTTTEQPSTEEKATSESTTTEQPSTEEKATSESTTTEQPSTEEKATSESTTTEQPSTEEKATSESTTTEQPSTEEKATSESTTTEQPSTEEKATSSGVNEQPETSASIQNISEDLNVSSDDTVQALENAGVDTSNASEVEAIAALIQNDYANNSNETPVATPLNINSATARNEETTNTLRPRLFAAMALAADTPTNDNVPNTDNNKIIEADALANGYIKSQTDATNAKNTLSGRAWIVDKGTPSTMSNGLTPVPEGTPVYMQWIDKDGVTSPIYKAATSNSIEKSDSSQVGPGAYAFDLRTPYVDANGKKHQYQAVDGQYYRIWIEDFKTKNGNTATMLRTAGGFLPGSYVNSATNNNIGQFPLLGTNMQRTGIFMGVEPDGEYMTRPQSEWIHDTQGADKPLSPNAIQGRVWLETGTGGDLANSGTGPSYNSGASDRIADGYTVVFSSLTNEGVQAYKNQVESLPKSEQADATRTLLTDHPEYISATVYGETNADGYYTVHFPTDKKINNDYIYGYVMNPDGEKVLGYSSFTSPIFTGANSNLSFTPQTAPVSKPAKGGWYNVNFALIPTTDTKIDIVKYNNTTQPAQPGDTINIDLSGSQLSPLPSHIEWRDQEGKVIKKTDDITSYTDGEQKGTFVVPEAAKAGDVYTVYLVSGGKDVGSDSFVVATQEKSYHPKTDKVIKEYGDPTTEDDVTGAVTIPDYPS